MDIPFPAGVQKGCINQPLNLSFWDEGYLYANCSFYTLTIYPKCLLFQFFSRGIRMHIPILAEVQTGRISRQNSSHILLKKYTFQA